MGSSHGETVSHKTSCFDINETLVGFNGLRSVREDKEVPRGQGNCRFQLLR